MLISTLLAQSSEELQPAMTLPWGKGVLVFSGENDVKIFIDGKLVGEVKEGSLRLEGIKPGNYNVKATLDGKKDIFIKAEVKPRKKTRIKLDFDRNEIKVEDDDISTFPKSESAVLILKSKPADGQTEIIVNKKKQGKGKVKLTQVPGEPIR